VQRFLQSFKNPNKKKSQLLTRISIDIGDFSDKFCAPDTITENTCYAIQRGERITCLRVTDSAECAIHLASGKADFGIFNTEELLLTYQFYPSIKPILQLRHKDKLEGN